MIPVESANIEALRDRVLQRFAALFANRTRTRQFAQNFRQLMQEINAEMAGNLQQASRLLDQVQIGDAERISLGQCLNRGNARSTRMDQALQLLFREYQRQWDESESGLKQVMLEFNDTVAALSGTLIEKDLLERQSRVLETIVLSHEKVTQWKQFVREILQGFHSIFPFNFFFIAFSEPHGLSLNLYYLGECPAEVRQVARTRLAREMIVKLGLPEEVSLDIEEYHVVTDYSEIIDMQQAELITVPVPDLEAQNLAGLLGVGFASAHILTPQEESVIRSTLAVMVMVVGSSKTLNRTLAELEYYSTHDPLTGLHNRRYFNEMVIYEEGRSARHQHQFVLLMLDLDNFKDVNDTYGHVCGDSALKQVAELLISVIRKGDVATRIGGDEFALVLTETSREGGLVVAEKLRVQLRESVFISPQGKRFHVTTSIGVVTYPDDASTVADLMAAVDIGLYRAKQGGKDGVGMVDSAKDRLQVSRGMRDQAEYLREALKNDQIIPYYQPIIDCDTGAMFAYEVLARLIEPDGGTVSAGVFIETLEKYGLGRDLDRAIISHALQQMRHHMDTNGSEPPRMFINLSAQEIQGRGILGFAEMLCQKLEIPPERVVFEILERDAIGDMTNMRKFLTDLRAKGFSFALDDFGSGYNSFHYLRELHVDYVKLDGEFVRNLLNSRVDRILVRNLGRMCQELGIRTVAEFVESAEIMDELQDMGVDYAQGYYLGLPSPQYGQP